MLRKLSVPLLLALLGLAVLAGVAPAQAELPPLIDRELFFGDPQISGAQISPDGEWITFVKPYQDVRNIWVKKLEEPFDAAKPLTADKRPVVGYFWSQDGRYVLYVQDKGGNENWHVYAVDPAGTPEAESGVPSARNLTPIEGARATIYALPENKPDVILVGLNDRDPMFSDVYTVSIATGDRTLLIKNTDSVGAYTFDLDGNVRLAMKQKEDGGSQYFRVEGNALIPVYEVSYLESAGPILFTKDGKQVYFETNKGDDIDFSRLVLMDPMTGKTELVESDPENQVDFGAPLFDSRTYELIGTVYDGDRQRIYARTPEFERDLKLIREKLPPGNVGLTSSTKDMRWHLIAVQSDVDPGSLYLYDRQAGEFTLLYRSRPDLPSENLAEMKAVRYKARDGMEIPAYLTLPKGVEAKNLAVVIHPHGGPWARDSWGYSPYPQFLANRGYAVLQPNFRTSTGYGKKFLNAGNHEWGTGAMQHDLTDAVQWLIKEGIADPKRVSIFGGSYGGYATLAGVTFTPDLYRCAIPYVAPSSLITLMESFPAYWRPFLKGSWYMRVGDPANPDDRKDLDARSPINFVDRIKVPLLVVHGANDPRVKQAESDRIVVSLRDRGTMVEYIVAPDEGHGFRSAENRMALAVSMERFLGKHLGGRVQTEVPDKIAARLEEITVDPVSVKLPDAAAQAVAESAKTSALPTLDGSLIADNKLTYTVNIDAGAQQMELKVSRTIEAIKDAGRSLWSVNDVIETPMGMQESTLLLDRKTLMPVSQTASGMGTIKLQYAEDKISGELVGGGQTLPVEVMLDAPVWTDGSGLALALAALPLAEGYTATVRMFEVNSQKVRTMKLAVTGSDITSCEAGSFPTFVVEVTPLDEEPGGGMKSWVTREAPHYSVRGEQKMLSMGGATMTSTLASMTSAAGAAK